MGMAKRDFELFLPAAVPSTLNQMDSAAWLVPAVPAWLPPGRARLATDPHLPRLHAAAEPERRPHCAQSGLRSLIRRRTGLRKARHRHRSGPAESFGQETERRDQRRLGGIAARR